MPIARVQHAQTKKVTMCQRCYMDTLCTKLQDDCHSCKTDSRICMHDCMTASTEVRAQPLLPLRDIHNPHQFLPSCIALLSPLNPHLSTEQVQPVTCKPALMRACHAHRDLICPASPSSPHPTGNSKSVRPALRNKSLLTPRYFRSILSTIERRDRDFRDAWTPRFQRTGPAASPSQPPSELPSCRKSARRSFLLVPHTNPDFCFVASNLRGFLGE